MAQFQPTTYGFPQGQGYAGSSGFFGATNPLSLNTSVGGNTQGGPVPPPILEKIAYSPAQYPVHFYRLANGHRVLIEQRPGTDIINLRTFINAGSINENSMIKSPVYGQTGFSPGIAHVDEHCHFPESWTEMVKSLGSRINASTDHEYIEHYITFNKEDTAKMLDFHAQALTQPPYDERDIEREKMAVVNEIAEKMKQPGTMVFSKTYELMFDRPFKQVGGGREDVLGVSRQQLESFVKTYYTPDNLVTVVSGNVDPQFAIQQLNKTFGAVPPRPRGPEAALKIALGPNEVRTAAIYHPQLEFSQMALSFPGPAAHDLRERMAMHMLLNYLADGSLSVLSKKMTLDSDTALDVGAGYRPLKAAGIVSFYVSTYPGKEQNALQTALGLIRQSATQPIPQQNLDQIRNRMIQGFKLGLNDVEGSTMSLGGELLTNSLDYYQNFIGLAQSITPQDLMQVAQKYLLPNRYALVYGLPGANRGESVTQSSQGTPTVSPYQAMAAAALGPQLPMNTSPLFPQPQQGTQPYLPQPLNSPPPYNPYGLWGGPRP